MMKKIVTFFSALMIFSTTFEICCLQPTKWASPSLETGRLFGLARRSETLPPNYPQLRITYPSGPEYQEIEERPVSPEPEPTQETEMTKSALVDDDFYVEDMNKSVLLGDISSVEGWQEVSEAERINNFKEFAENRFQHTAQQSSYGTQLEPPVRSLRIFRPRNVPEAAQKQLTLWIHGTFAHKGRAYTQEEHAEFRAIKDFVESNAKFNHAIGHLINYAWSGHVVDEDREQAGKQLADFLNKFGKNYSKITIIAHSHGCNVVNIASQTLKNTISIDQAIYLAGPVREDEKAIYKPTERIKNIYNFYSTNDPIQLLGSMSLPTFGWRIYDTYTGRRYNTVREHPHIVNIQTISNDVPQDHSKIRMMLAFLYKILQTIDTEYKGCTELTVYTLSDSQGQPLDAKVTLPENQDLRQISLRKLSDEKKQKVEEYSIETERSLEFLKQIK